MAKKNKGIEAKAYLDRLLETKKIPHLLLFSGRSNEAIAESFAKRLLQTDNPSHPDLFFYHPEGKLGMHSIDKMRTFCQDVRLPPYLANYRVFIVYEADRMPLTSSNALLKTFEEPISTSVILLLTSKESALLPTVRSRCQVVRVSGDEEYEPLSPQLMHLLQGLSSLPLSSLQAQAKKLSEMFSEKEEIQTVEGETAYQKGEREKKEEGHLALNTSKATTRLLESILHFYRDLEVMRWGGEKDLLYYPLAIEAYQQMLDKGELPSQDIVAAILNDVKLRLERSHPKELAFEAMLHSLRQL